MLSTNNSTKLFKSLWCTVLRFMDSLKREIIQLFVQNICCRFCGNLSENYFQSEFFLECLVSNIFHITMHKMQFRTAECCSSSQNYRFVRHRFIHLQLQVLLILLVGNLIFWYFDNPCFNQCYFQKYSGENIIIG